MTTSDPYRYFRVEAQELLDQLVRGVLDLEQDGSAAPVVARLLRQAHTLKGAARVVRHAPIADRAHAFEGLLEPHREEGADQPPREVVAAALAIVDEIGAELAAISEPAGGAAAGASPPSVAAAPPADGPRAPSDDRAPGRSRPAATTGDERRGPAPVATARAEVADIDAALAAVIEAGTRLDAVKECQARVASLTSLVSALVTSPARPGSAPARAAPSAAGVTDLRRAITATARSLDTAVRAVEQELDAAQQAAERLRLVPLDSCFTVLERTARDIAIEKGRAVSFTSDAQGIRLDREVLEAVEPALVQLVRNAVAHGIEPPADRVAAGKPRSGRVAVAVRRQGDRVTFACSDDGRGVDVEAVRAAAVERGLAEDAARGLDVDDVMALLMRGGISTARVVTGASGRGIGLDVLRDAAQRVGGAVRVVTRDGTGTTVELDVPLTLATSTVVRAEAAGTTVCVPLYAVEAVLVVVADQVLHGSAGPTVALGDSTVPVVSLPALLHRGSSAGHLPASSPALLVRAGGSAVVTVDRIVGVDAVVMRPLPPLTPEVPLVTGLTVTADGRPQLVLDPAGVVGAVGWAEAPAAAAPPRRRILVVDDSLTTRMLEQSILEAAGFEVGLATSGEEALATLDVDEFDLALIDVEMPGIDGFALVERLRADPRHSSLPAILVTSLAAPEHVERGALAGADGYIVKGDFDQSQMLRRIGELLEAR